MMTLNDIRLALQDRRIGLVAQATGLHVNTIRDLRDSENANPSYRVLVAVSDYLEKTASILDHWEMCSNRNLPALLRHR